MSLTAKRAVGLLPMPLKSLSLAWNNFIFWPQFGRLKQNNNAMVAVAKLLNNETEKPHLVPLKLSSNGAYARVVYIDEKVPLFILFKHEILVQKVATSLHEKKTG